MGKLSRSKKNRDTGLKPIMVPILSVPAIMPFRMDPVAYVRKYMLESLGHVPKPKRKRNSKDDWARNGF